MSKSQVGHLSELFQNLSQAQRNFDKAMVALLPENYIEPANHLMNANIEVLKAISSLIDNRIEGLEYMGAELQKKQEKTTVKREKVEVE